MGSLFGTLGSGEVSPQVLILAFVPVMLVASAATGSARRAERARRWGACPPARPGRIVVAGTGVGLLTGFFGVGGGFMIVPVLILWLGFSFRRAVATSLLSST